MDILVIGSKFPYPLTDGGAIATYNLISGLANQQNRIHILSFNAKKHHIEPGNIPMELFQNIDFSIVEIDTTPSFSGLLKNLFFSKNPYILDRLRSEKFKTELIRLLNLKSFDIVHIEGLYMLQYSKIVKANLGAKISYRPHNIEHEIWQNLKNGHFAFLKKIYFKILSKRILKYELSKLNTYDLIVPISGEDSNFFKAAGNRMPELIVPTGFEIPSVEIFRDKNINYNLYFLGSLEWIPNQEGIVWFINNCWSILQKRFPTIRCYIAGRNTPENLKKQFSIPGIVWVGEVDNASNFIKDKSIMIVPLLSGSGMRIKIIEAFLQCKPVVSTTLGSRGTMSENGKNILLADTPDKFAETLINLLTDSDLYEKLSKSAYELANENFDIKLISNKLITFYKQHIQ